MLSDIEIAQKNEMKPIVEIAEKLALSEDDLDLYGKYKAKINLTRLNHTFEKRKTMGKLILVTSINPTPAGEGKTTVSVGFADALSLRPICYFSA